MLIIPAIDLLGRNAVRLRRGEERTARVYSENPLETALAFQACGAPVLHLVDLDAAFGRPDINAQTIESILRRTALPVQLGGGIRSLEKIAFWLGRGIRRVILGSAAVSDPRLVEHAVRRFGADSLAVGLDLRDGRAATHGWTKTGPDRALTVARRLASAGIRRLIITETASDGMLSGIRTENAAAIASDTGLSVIVSGGVRSLEDLERLAGITRPRFEGIVVGRALYENRLSLRDAVEAFRE